MIIFHLITEEWEIDLGLINSKFEMAKKSYSLMTGSMKLIELI